MAASWSGWYLLSAAVALARRRRPGDGKALAGPPEGPAPGRRRRPAGGEGPLGAHHGIGVQLPPQWEELRSLRPARETRRPTAGPTSAPSCPAGRSPPASCGSSSDEGLLKFLRQLHPGARLKLHINNGDSRGGGYGCLRACDGRWADVLFRAHAEFALKDGVYTPGQFAGRLVLDRSSGKAAYFRLYLPPSPGQRGRRLRGTPELKVGGQGAAAGRSGPRTPVRCRGWSWSAGTRRSSGAADRVPGKAAERGERRLRAAVLPVQGDRLGGLRPGRGGGAADRKPLHVIASDGTLDDESC